MKPLTQINQFKKYLYEKQLITNIEILNKIDLLKENLVDYLIQHEIISEKILLFSLSDYFNLPIMDLSDYSAAQVPKNILSSRLMQKYTILPIISDQQKTVIAIYDPTNSSAIEAIHFHIPYNVTLKVAKKTQLIRLIDQLMAEHHIQSLKQHRNSVQQEHEKPVVSFIDTLIKNAINHHVSDIHFEIYENSYRIRFRENGLLANISAPPKHLAEQINSRLKIMANLDIAEKRLPQDGHFKVTTKNQQTIDIRLSSCPTLHGEKIVLRLLNKETLFRNINELGFQPSQQKEFLQSIHKPQGLILVTGPTGSGKTITLYAALKQLNVMSRNIVTVEDPAEINLSGINQVNINQKAGLTFPVIMRAFLRQDPDVIMIGEIRDFETAQIALRAAQTGHLVLSTLHTRSAIEALNRLRQMGIPDYDIIDSITLITAQRLIRLLCPYCKKKMEIHPNLIRQFSLENNHQLYTPGNCKKCLNGYTTRIAIHEIIKMNDAFRKTFLNKKIMDNKPTTTLKTASIDLLKQGLTSIEEIYRVLDHEESK